MKLNNVIHSMVIRCLSALYSLLFSFNQFTISTNSFNKSLSNILNNNNNSSYKNICVNGRTLVFEDNPAKSDENFDRTKIVNLVINSYFDFIDWISRYWLNMFISFNFLLAMYLIYIHWLWKRICWKHWRIIGAIIVYVINYQIRFVI